MRKIIKYFKKLFCKHEWTLHSSIYDPDLTRTCIRCKQEQFVIVVIGIMFIDYSVT